MLFLAAACTLAAQDPREIVRRSVQLMDHNLAIARNYTFLERSDTRELDSAGQVKTHKILLYDVTMLEGSPYRRLVGKDDHGLTPEEERIEQKKLADSIAQRRKETPAEHARRIADWEKKRQREREPLDEVPDAFDFRMAGEAHIDGRPAWIIEGTPRPGYHARSTVAKLFPKFTREAVDRQSRLSVGKDRGRGDRQHLVGPVRGAPEQGRPARYPDDPRE